MVGVTRVKPRNALPRHMPTGVVLAANSFGQYLERLPEAHQQALKRLRQAVIAAVPDVEETVRRGVPAFRYRAKPLVSIGAALRHVSLYVMYGAVLTQHKGQLEAYDTSNTVVRFDPTVPIPVRLVKTLVRARAVEIDGTCR